MGTYLKCRYQPCGIWGFKMAAINSAKLLKFLLISVPTKNLFVISIIHFLLLYPIIMYGLYMVGIAIKIIG